MFSLFPISGLSLAYLYAGISIACAVLASSILVPIFLERLQTIRREQRLQQRLQESADIQTSQNELGGDGSGQGVLQSSADLVGLRFYQRPLFAGAGEGLTSLCARTKPGRHLLLLMTLAGFDDCREALLQWLLLATGSLAVLTLLMGSVVLVPIVLVLLGIGCFAYLQSVAEKRRKALRAALPDMLDELAQSLRAGRSFPQSISFVLMSQPEGSPLVELLRRLDADLRLGRSLSLSLIDLSESARLRELKSFAAVIEITAQVGGSAPSLFEEAATSIRQDLMLNSKLAIQTAQGRSSVRLVGSVPFVLLGIMALAMPEYLGAWLSTMGGQLLFVFALCLIAGGFLWVRKVVNIYV